MPFTLAHPAAVLPLKRFCPRYLSFSALLIGSTTPDAGYALSRYKMDTYAHSFVGSFVFCLPVGLLMLAALYGLRRPVVERLPVRLREVYQPLSRQPIASPLILILSLLMGTWTHLAWDEVTHSHSRSVLDSRFLQTPLFSIHGQIIQVCHVLWYLSSFAGVAVLCFAYELWRRKRQGVSLAKYRGAAILHAVVIGELALPIEAIHHIRPGLVTYAITGFCSAALIIFVMLKIGNAPNQAAR
jgi:Domain of unknown function (DUF4184)